jgi:Histone methylation protein DOT1
MLYAEAQAIAAKLEAANLTLYNTIRREIQSGARPKILLQSILQQPDPGEAPGPANGFGYDYLDELLAGVFQFTEPTANLIHSDPEMVPYQPTPARHIFDLLRLTALTPSDVLVDLGSGLGHVSLLVSICTSARSIGIELEQSYIERARQSAHLLNLDRVLFLHQDARSADLSTGTVFYLHTPFTGSILRHVFNLLRREAATRPIRICTFGPGTPLIAQEPWLQSTNLPQTNRIALFHPRS